MSVHSWGSKSPLPAPVAPHLPSFLIPPTLGQPRGQRQLCPAPLAAVQQGHMEHASPLAPSEHCVPRLCSVCVLCLSPPRTGAQLVPQHNSSVGARGRGGKGEQWHRAQHQRDPPSAERSPFKTLTLSVLPSCYPALLKYKHRWQSLEQRGCAGKQSK